MSHSPSTPDLAALRSEADRLCADPRFLGALRRHCSFARSDRLQFLNARIHPADPMLWHSLRHHHDANRSVSQYFNVALQQHSATHQILRACLGPGFERHSILDFACGHGRNVRFLSLSFPADRVWACDVQREAVDFCSNEFGVKALYSSTEPDLFDPGRPFDFIWVASLFSHLPDHLFKAWVKRLHSLLTSDGVLCFSVHDESILPQGVSMTGDILYIPASENQALDGKIYGTTFVTERYVRQAMLECGADVTTTRIRRGLANEQDLYVVMPSSANTRALAGFRRGPWGWVDRLTVSDRGELEVHGWAGSLDDGNLGQVEIRLDDEEEIVETKGVRPDVARVLEDDRLARSGFDYRHRLGDSPSFLEVIARSRENETALIYAGPVVSELSNPTGN